MGSKPSKRRKEELPPEVDLSLRDGNPHYGPRMRLYCRHDLILTLYPNGKVVGINSDPTEYSIMEFTSAGAPGEVRIRAVRANLYVAINRKGKLYGEVSNDDTAKLTNIYKFFTNPEKVDPWKEETIFIESLFGSYNTYLSKRYAYMGWYVGLMKTGKPKNAKRTKWGQKAIQFLPLRVENE